MFSTFWERNRLLLKRIHGAAAIDPECGEAVEARNQRRHAAAARVIGRLGDRVQGQKAETIAILVALTSFELFDALAESSGSVEAARKRLPGLIRSVLLKG